MPPRTIKLAAGQMLVEGGRPAANLERAEAMVDDAARRGCQVIVLPECLDVGWTHPSARELAEPIPGPRSDRLAAVAARHRILVIAGLTEREGERVYNAAVMIDEQGRILLTYRKINELAIAHDLYAIGDRLGVARTSLGTLGVNICADNFPNAPELGGALARMGAELLASPSSWAVDASHDERTERYGALWRKAYRRLARQYQMPVVGVSNVGQIVAGPWAGRRCIGCSLAVDARGRQILRGPADEPALLVTVLELAAGRPRGTDISGCL